MGAFAFMNIYVFIYFDDQTVCFQSSDRIRLQSIHPSRPRTLRCSVGARSSSRGSLTGPGASPPAS